MMYFLFAMRPLFLQGPFCASYTYSMIGIGISTTVERKEVFYKTLSQIEKFAPNGSKIIWVTDYHHEGIAVTKNKCLAKLVECDHIFLFDDDLYPVKKGWADLYVEAAEMTGFSQFNLTIPYTSFHDEIKIVDHSTYIVYFEGVDPIFTSHADKKSIMELRRQHGLPFNAKAKIVEDKFMRLKYHHHPNGFMMYIGKKCLDTIGGFDERFQLYGGEHANYSTRAKNAGLTPHYATDVVGSNEYFYSLDAHKKVKSSLTKKQMMEHAKENDSLFQQEKFSSQYFPF